jgi:SNF2 family DNA or RNA helicase
VIVADVRVAGTMLRVVPRRGADLSGLLRALRAKTPPGTVRRDGKALMAPARGLTWLLDAGEKEALGVALGAEAVRALEVRRHAAMVHGDYRDHVTELRMGGVELARAELNDRPADQDIAVLDDHQLVNVAAMTAAEGYGMLLFDEQGAGKTVSVIYAFDRLVGLNTLDTMVVVAPKSMVGEWANAVGEFMGDRYRVEIVSGTGAERARRVDSGADIVVMNYEAVRTVRDPLVRRLRRHPDRALLVVDESFAVKNPQARRTRELEAIRDWFGRCCLLCGTPAPNTAHDIVAQVSMVDFGETFAGVDIPDDRAQAVPVVRRALDDRAIFMRNLKVNVLPDLPGRAFTRLAVPLAPLQGQLYAAAHGALIAEIEALDENQFLKQLGNFLARRMALLRIASNPAGVFETYDELPGKLVALDTLIKRLVEHDGEKLVIWSSFTHSLGAIVRRYARHGTVRYDGSVTSIEERREAVHRFQNDPATRIFVGNPAAAGAGLTLHAARYAVYESFTNQAAQYLQSLDRIHRRGQVREVEYFVLLAENSVESTEFDNLIRKEERARDLLGDVVPEPITREQFLAELRASWSDSPLPAAP